MNFRLILLVYLLFGLMACSEQNPVAVVVNSQPQALFQVSTIDALLQGVYDGSTSLKELSEKGDFGIGTVNTLDGEMVLENGVFYHVKSDGGVYPLSLDDQTPFASVVQFSPEDTIDVEAVSFEDLKLLIDSLAGSLNYFYAVRVEGAFEYVHTRSVPAQKRPYPPLVEVTSNQPEFNMYETNGMLTGFYCPEFVKGVNVTGYHLHYLTEDKKQGGHLLDFELKSGRLLLDKIDRFEMQLPSSEDFENSEFKTDRSEELKKVEG